MKENNTPQLAIENTPATQQPIENTPTTQQPIENSEATTYDFEIENTLNKMTDNTGFFKTTHDPQRGWMINNHPIKMLRGTKVEINENKYSITPGLQKNFTDTKYETAESMSDTEKVVFKDILSKTIYYNRKLTKGKMSGRDRYIKNDLDNDVIKILNLDKKLRGKGVEKIIIPSNISDIYTRLEVLLGIKLSGHTDSLTEASNLIDELYKRGELQNEQQYRNALNKFSSIYMELPSKLLEQIAHIKRPKLEEHMLIVMDKSIHEEHLFQSLQTNDKQFKIAVTFLTCYNGIFNVTNSNNKFYFTTSISDIETSLIVILTGAYELESLDAEIKRMFQRWPFYRIEITF